MVTATNRCAERPSSSLNGCIRNQNSLNNLWGKFDPRDGANEVGVCVCVLVCVCMCVLVCLCVCVGVYLLRREGQFSQDNSLTQ